jgi:hypothetical protein
MKRFIIQLEVYVSEALDADGGDYLDLERFGEGLATFTTHPTEHLGWCFVYDGPEDLPLDELIGRVVDELAPVDVVMSFRSVERAVLSVGVMTDKVVTAIDLAPETISTVARKLKGVGLQFMVYPTDFGKEPNGGC